MSYADDTEFAVRHLIELAAGEVAEVVLDGVVVEPQRAHGQVLQRCNAGAYMVNAAGCKVCHTKVVNGKEVGEPFAGGFEFQFPDGSIARSSNITPDKLHGIGAWDKATFIRKFKLFADSSYTPATVDWQGQDQQTVMPWMMYAGMTEQDLGAIYDYLHALKPVANQVQYWSPAN